MSIDLVSRAVDADVSVFTMYKQMRFEILRRTGLYAYQQEYTRAYLLAKLDAEYDAWASYVHKRRDLDA